MSTTGATIDPERRALGEVEMLGEERWEEVHRRAAAGASIRAIARELDLDRKTVRRCLRQSAWRPYQRAAREDTLLAPYVRQRAAEVGHSARVLFQELRRRRYEGSYETVKRFVRPLRETQLRAAVTRTRFETPQGPHRNPESIVFWANLAKMDRALVGSRMKTLSAKDAKYGFGRLIDLARAEPVTVAKHGRPVVVVMAVEEYERLKCFKTGHVDSRPSTTGKAE